MYAKKSTKKLTHFEEFALTPSAKHGGGSNTNKAFISPVKLKKLEKRHNVCLTGRNNWTRPGPGPTEEEELNERSQEDDEDEEIITVRRGQKQQ